MDSLWTDIERDGPTPNLNGSTSNRAEVLDLVSEWTRREQFVGRYSWAVPSRDAIERIRDFIGLDKVIEVGAGSGLWAYLLQQVGVDIHPTDNKSEPNHSKACQPFGIDSVPQHLFTRVEELDAIDAIKKYPERTCLMLCWSRVNPTKEFQGDKIVYVGEGKNGCTAGIPDKDNWETVETVSIPTWYGIHDFVRFYRRRVKITQLPLDILRIIVKEISDPKDFLSLSRSNQLFHSLTSQSVTQSHMRKRFTRKVIREIRDYVIVSTILPNGKWDGVYRKYVTSTDKTVLWFQCEYDNGRLHGMYLEIWLTGDRHVYCRIPYKNGHMDGVAQLYWSDGLLRAEETHVNGKMLGTSRRWETDGTLSESPLSITSTGVIYPKVDAAYDK